MNRQLRHAVVAILAACPALCLGAQAAPKVAVSIPPQKAVVAAVVGDACDVLVLVDVGGDPHTFEPTPRQLAALRDRPIYFTIGLPFEQVLADKLQKLHPTMRFVAMSPSPSMAPRHAAELDPHVWMSPDRLAEHAAATATALARIDPTNAARYAAGAADFAEKVAALKAGLAARLREADVAAFAVYHPAWGHFAEAFGLEQLAIEAHGQSPGARHLADFTKQVRERGVKTILVQNEAERRRVAPFARQNNLRVAIVNPLAEDVIATLRATADALCGANAKPAGR
ncbi:MAG: metal ABC transporter solute-binding protein, Zn/Mn family [Kiritimatiellia bacterium]|jgi:zinc transport system substrate-binding protein